MTMWRVLVGLLAGLSVWSWAAAATLKVATLAPEGSNWMKEMRAAGEAIKTASAGRVELKFFPGGVMGNAETVLRKIKLGQLHGGAFAVTELASVNPDVQVYGLPFLFSTVEEVRAVRKTLDPLVKKGFEDKGMVIAGLTGGGFVYLMSTQSIASQEELRRTKVWVPEGDRVGRIAFAEAGISPVVLSLGDVYTALQTGLVETVGNTTTGAVAFQWATKLRYMVDLPVAYTMGLLAFDQKALGRLDEADRASVIREIEAAFARLETSNEADDRATRQTLLKEGITLQVPSPEEIAKWRAVGERTRARMQAEGLISAEILSALDRARQP
jgi:TRAP-type C4-dicarboxylate transport system substrate-binding protein